MLPAGPRSTCCTGTPPSLLTLPSASPCRAAVSRRVIACGLLDRAVLRLLHRFRQRDAAAPLRSDRMPGSPCADNSRGSRPAAAQRRLPIRLIYCGAGAVDGAKRGAFAMSVRSATPSAPRPAAPRRRRRRLVAAEPDSEAGQGGGIRGRAIEGSGGSSCTCSARSPATSLRRRPPEAKATVRMAAPRASA